MMLRTDSHFRGRHRRSTTVGGPIQAIHRVAGFLFLRFMSCQARKASPGTLRGAKDRGKITVDLYWRHEDEGNMTEIADTFDSAFTKAVDLGNRLADKDKDADLWDIADGLLAGALQYWLYSRQPCGDPRCQDCMPISTAEGRMAELKRLMEQLAAESEYFHTPTDANAGRA
jgi:hypothetical protein